MKYIAELVLGGLLWGRTVSGLIVAPYETYRRIVNHGKRSELLFIAATLVCYFGLASIVKVAAFRPFLLTRQFIVLSAGATANMVVAIGSLWVAGKLIGATIRLSQLTLAWGYTLIPTVLWFLMTSVLYVLLPPPRTTSAAGLAFSTAFIIVSTVLLWWKIMLSYLTIRFVYRASVGTILLIYAIILPILFMQSVVMYRLGVFKVPFL